jgi:hypothetical protein
MCSTKRCWVSSKRIDFAAKSPACNPAMISSALGRGVRWANERIRGSRWTRSQGGYALITSSSAAAASLHPFAGFNSP